MHILIVGTHGIPAKHGGFETFAEDFSLYMNSRGHRVTIYCPTTGNGSRISDSWNGIERVLIPTADGPLATIGFDWESVRLSSRENGVILTLGYGTALFSFLYRMRRVPNVMNMDGIEWKREKWSLVQRLWLWFNERIGARIATHLVADHPEILKHLC